MKRFALYGGFLVPSDEGRYVMYSEANARIAELEGAIKEAPHGVSCATLYAVPSGAARWICNCWKRAALGE